MSSFTEPTKQELDALMTGFPEGKGSPEGDKAVMATAMRAQRGENFLSSKEKFRISSK